MEYQFLRRLTQGGFSEVFEVADSRAALRERLVLKRLSPEMSARPAVRTAFSIEAQMLRELKHPNIVTFRRCFFDDASRVCLLMEMIEGESLDRWAKQQDHDPEAVLGVFGQILAAVDYLHHRSRPYLHLDLKPDNILVSSSTPEPRPVLIDFGIARSRGEQGLKAYTPPYGAPEQQAGQEMGCFTDVFALGQILAELIELLAGSLDPAARKAFQAVADRARHISRGRRYADAGAMIRGFREARATRSTGTPKTTLAAGSVGRFLPLALRVAVGLAASILVVLAVLALSGAFDSPEVAPVVVESAERKARFDEHVRQGRQAFGTASGWVAIEHHYTEAKLLLESESDAALRREMQKQLEDYLREADFYIEGERRR